MPKQTDQTCPHAKNCWKGGGSYKCKYNPPFCEKPLFPKNSSNWQNLELPRIGKTDNEEENKGGDVERAVASSYKNRGIGKKMTDEQKYDILEKATVSLKGLEQGELF